MQRLTIEVSTGRRVVVVVQQRLIGDQLRLVFEATWQGPQNETEEKELALVISKLMGYSLNHAGVEMLPLQCVEVSSAAEMRAVSKKHLGIGEN